MAARRALRFCLLFLVIGCSSHLEHGRDLYASGRYVDAAQVFERTEARLIAGTPKERARYGLYRGATLLALGDLQRARIWLRYADATERASPSALEPAERTLLAQGLAHVAPPSAAPTASATPPPPVVVPGGTGDTRVHGSQRALVSP